MFFASLCFLLGTGLNAGAHNLAMLVVGRILLGFGIGSANTAVPLYLVRPGAGRRCTWQRLVAHVHR